MTSKYYFNMNYISTKHRKTPCEILVLNMYMLDMLNMCGENPLVLNMANPLNPGGNYKNQKKFSGQEENLFNTSNISTKISQEHYPIKNDEVLVTDCVSRGNDIFGVISCPSLDMRCRRFTEKELVIMYRKIDLIFQVANKLGYKDIILSALGCGAFMCSPVIISEIFKEVLGEYKYSFDKVIFAIRDYDDNYNYNVFKKTFSI